MESATRGLDAVIYSLPLGPGDRIHASTQEYASNFIALLQLSRRTGARVEVMETDADGLPDLEALHASLDERSRVVVLTHVPASSGAVNPAAEVGAVVRPSPAIYIVDACQSAGQLPVDVDDIGCDVLVGTGRKYLRGPRGTGFLYVRGGVLDAIEPATLDYHAADWPEAGRYAVRGDARRYESFEFAVAARSGSASPCATPWSGAWPTSPPGCERSPLTCDSGWLRSVAWRSSTAVPTCAGSWASA